MKIKDNGSRSDSKFEIFLKDEPLPKVLLVDDDEDIQIILKTALESEGFEVETAGDGLTAKTLIGLKKYKAVISDVKMPGSVSGLDLLEYIQKEHSTTPVVLMSGCALETEKAFNLGARFFLAKPFKREELMAALKNESLVGTCLYPHSLESGKKVEVQNFLVELSAFAKKAEETLSSVSSKAAEKSNAFRILSEKMLENRGTAEHLGLNEIAEVATLSSEIAAQAIHGNSVAMLRNCAGILWESLASVKYLLKHNEEEIANEQDIIINRLLSTLKSIGAAQTENPCETDSLFQSKE